MDTARLGRVVVAVCGAVCALGCGDSTPNSSSTSTSGGTQSAGGAGATGGSVSTQGGSGSGVGGSGVGGSVDSGGSAGTATSESGGTAGTTAGGSGGGPTGSSGCGKAATMTGPQADVITVDGVVRTFDFEVPTTYSPDEVIPVVFGFHGNGGNGVQSFNFGINAAAWQAGKNAIFIFPDGVAQQGGVGWDQSEDGDVLLFDALLEWAETNFCIDEKKVFLAGFSWGNDFANTLGCYRGDKIRAINGFSGGFYNQGCDDVTPAYRATYSTPDGTDAYSQSAIDKAVNHYKDALGCSDTTQAIDPSPCLAYDGCSAPVIFCAYENMGHSVPAGGGADAWNFFASFE